MFVETLATGIGPAVLPGILDVTEPLSGDVF
jgi:hypothetical protein